MNDEALEEARPWYAAGLYRRIQERRKWQPQRTPRKPLREMLRERGLHWSLEVVVGAFVAVVAASLITVALATGGSSGSLARTQGASGSGGPGGAVSAPPTPDCIAAPIAGSTKRVCTQPTQ